MFVSPGEDLDLYLELSRNGEPVDSESSPTVHGLWFAGNNLLSLPVLMNQLDTGLYYASLALDPETDLGIYKAEIHFERLGVLRREIQDVQVVVSSKALLDNIEGLFPGNTQIEFVRALADNLAMNVKAGRLSHINFKHKRNSDSGYSTPVVSNVRQLQYEALGDINPIIVEGN